MTYLWCGEKEKTCCVARSCLQATQHHNMSNREKVVLITGCSSGIGKALALEFKKHNCRVFASARTVSKLGDLRDAGIDLVQLDITDTDSMEVYTMDPYPVS